MDNFDTYIGKRIKQATARQRTPAGVRSRLLKAAAGSDPQRQNKLSILSIRHNFERRHLTSEWATHLIEWAVVDPFYNSSANMRIIL